MVPLVCNFPKKILRLCRFLYYWLSMSRSSHISFGWPLFVERAKRICIGLCSLAVFYSIASFPLSVVTPRLSCAYFTTFALRHITHSLEFYGLFTAFSPFLKTSMYTLCMQTAATPRIPSRRFSCWNQISGDSTSGGQRRPTGLKKIVK